MSKPLSEQKFHPLDTHSKALTTEQITEYAKELKAWTLVEDAGTQMLQRTYKFESYKACLLFSSGIGLLAEAFDHHPRQVVEWGKVQLVWWTHMFNGLHLNDFIMAAKSDKLYEQQTLI